MNLTILGKLGAVAILLIGTLNAGCANRDLDLEEDVTDDAFAKDTATNVKELVVDPTGQVFARIFNPAAVGAKHSLSRIDPRTGTLTPAPAPRVTDAEGAEYPADPSLSFAVKPLTYDGLVRITPIEETLFSTRYPRIRILGFDTTRLYFLSDNTEPGKGGTLFSSIGFGGDDSVETLGKMRGGGNNSAPVSTLVAGDGIFWTEYPNTCTFGASKECWNMKIGHTKQRAGLTSEPRLANGTYVAPEEIAFYENNLYLANESGIYKIPGADLTRPVEPVCAFKTSLKSESLFSFMLGGAKRSRLVVTDKGFVLPTVSADTDKSSISLVGWDCSEKSLSVVPRNSVAQIVVSGGTVFWLQAAKNAYDLKRSAL